MFFFDKSTLVVIVFLGLGFFLDFVIKKCCDMIK